MKKKTAPTFFISFKIVKFAVNLIPDSAQGENVFQGSLFKGERNVRPLRLQKIYFCRDGSEHLKKAIMSIFNFL